MAASVERVEGVLTVWIRLIVTSDDEKRNREKRDPRSKQEKRRVHREREREKRREETSPDKR